MAKSFAIGSLILVLGALTAAGADWTGVCVEVHDGDTVSVSRGQQAVAVNLADVDAPEIDQAYGPEAKELLENLLLGAEVKVVNPQRDADGQITARVKVGGLDASRRLLDAGLAWTGDTKDEGLILASIQARGEGRGLWGSENPTPPWTWRKRQIAMTPTPVPMVRSLRDAALMIELKKNRNGRAVISGLPSSAAEGEDDAGLVAAAGGLQSSFECVEDELQACAQEKFRRAYGAAYDDDPGAYELTSIDLGGGSLTLMFSGRSSDGFPYGLPMSCQCSSGECACVMRMPARGAKPTPTPTPPPQPETGADAD